MTHTNVPKSTMWEWHQKLDTLVLFLVFFLIPVVGHAGGLGMAPIAAIAGGFGILGLNKSAIRGFPENITAPIWMVLILLAWGLVSSIWSPYQSSHFLSNPLKLMIGVPLFLAGALLVARQGYRNNHRLVSFIVLITTLSALVLSFDIISGYKLSFLLNPFKDGEEFAKRTADTIQNIGHGNSVLAIMFVPTALLAWMRGGKWRLFACNLAALVLFTTYISGTAANLVAVIAACLIMIIGYFWPKIALHLSFLVAGIVVTAAPILAFTASRLTPAFKAKLPFSWEERVENWSYLYDRIFEKPVFGHGFDAVRTFTETHTIRGFPDRAYVSLHPHNAGLHIWVELGFVGAVMVYFALYLGAKHLTQPGRLNHGQMVATAGLVMSATVISSLSYGVWQDWWWATVILGASVISLIRTAPRVGK